MSLDTGKKLGLTASLIAVIAPVIIIVLNAIMFFTLLSNLSSAISQRGTLENSLPFSLGIFSLTVIAVLVISVIGFILFLIAMYELGHYYQEPGIFRNLIYSIISLIVGFVVVVAIVVVFAFSLVTGLANADISSFFSLIGLFLGIIAAIFITSRFQAALLGSESMRLTQPP